MSTSIEVLTKYFIKGENTTARDKYDAADSETKLPVTDVIKWNVFLIHHSIPVKNQLTIQQLFIFIFLVREPDCFRSRTHTVTQHAQHVNVPNCTEWVGGGGNSW